MGLTPENCRFTLASPGLVAVGCEDLQKTHGGRDTLFLATTGYPDKCRPTPRGECRRRSPSGPVWWCAGWRSSPPGRQRFPTESPPRQWRSENNSATPHLPVVACEGKVFLQHPCPAPVRYFKRLEGQQANRYATLCHDDRVNFPPMIGFPCRVWQFSLRTCRRQPQDLTTKI